MISLKPNSMLRSHPAKKQMSDGDGMCQSSVTTALTSIHPDCPPSPPEGHSSSTRTWTQTLHIVALTLWLTLLSQLFESASC